MRLFVLLTGLCSGCFAFVPRLPTTIATATYIVRPEQGCIQGIYVRGHRGYYWMRELGKNGTRIAGGPNTDYTLPLLRATRDDLQSHAAGRAALRLKQGATAAEVTGTVLGLGLWFSGVLTLALSVAHNANDSAIGAPLILGGMGVGVTGFALGFSLERAGHAGLERVIPLYNEHAATAGCKLHSAEAPASPEPESSAAPKPPAAPAQPPG